MNYDWKKIVVSATVGNILGLYDFILYAYFSQIISQLFFPAFDHFVSMMLTFGVFATGCLIRPVGAIFFGYVGDRFGRKKTLVLSITMITLATTTFGLLPTYHQIGAYASFLLLLCRLLQGVSMSGEETSAAVFLSEISPPTRQGLAGSIILGSVYVGLLLGSIVALIAMSCIPENDLMTWGWRIPFLLSFFFGIGAIVIRAQQTESIPFMQAQKNQLLVKNPIREVVLMQNKALIKSILACTTLAVAVYLFAVYIPSQLTTQFGIRISMAICSVSFFVIAVFVVLVGLWVDKIGFRLPTILSCVGFILFSYPIFSLLAQKNIESALLAEFILLLLLGLSAGSLMPLLIQSFPVPTRLSGVSIAFNFSMTFFGGTTPLLALYLTKLMNTPTAPFVCLIGGALLTLFSLYTIKQGNNDLPCNSLSMMT
jgi:MFS transporter, MHS family, proline/betaine transporter